MIKEAIVKIVNKGDLSYDEAYAVMNEIMSGETSPTQNAAFLAALSTKSTKAETIVEIAGCAAAMRDHATKVKTDMDLFEIVGTGGDNAGSFNISTTAALALVVFIYFVRVGMKNHGVWGYIKSLAPKGVMFPLNILIWVIELISTLLRPITLAVRLFCNMFAGHIVLGSFALMVSLFAEPLIAQFTAANVLGAIPSLVFGAILFVIYAIEIFVGVIQAYVFTVLTAVYIQGAEAEGH